MAKHGHGKTIIDSFVVIKMRYAACNKCQSTYKGPDNSVVCRGCKKVLVTQDVSAEQKIPVGVWLVANLKQNAIA